MERVWCSHERSARCRASGYHSIHHRSSQRRRRVRSLATTGRGVIEERRRQQQCQPCERPTVVVSIPVTAIGPGPLRRCAASARRASRRSPESLLRARRNMPRIPITTPRPRWLGCHSSGAQRSGCFHNGHCGCFRTLRTSASKSNTAEYPGCSPFPVRSLR